MGVMNSIRERAGGLMVGVLVVAFGGLWALQDSGAFDTVGMGRDGRVIGEVDGIAIEGELYNRALEQQLDSYQAQGLEVSATQQRQIEDQLFDQFVDNALIERAMDEFGVEVTDDEVIALITGPTPDPLIAQVFPDGNGGVDRGALQQVVEDPQFADQLQAIEEQVRRNRRQAKLAALVTASARVTPGEVEAEFVRRNRRGTAQVVGLRYASVPDDQVEVSDSDLQRYYRDHLEDYEREASYSVEYVTFDKNPSAADSARATSELAAMVDGLRSAEDPIAFARRNSFGAAIEPAFEPVAALPGALATAVASDPTPGRVVGPVVADGQAYLARITDVRTGGEPSTKARHILLPVDQADEARALRQRIEAGELTFAQAAAQFSTDPSNRATGGDLGWFDAEQMVPAFQAAAASAPVGQVVGPVQTQFGQHLILVEARTDREVELVRIARPVEADYARVLGQAEDFVANIELEGRSFAEEAGAQGIAPTPTEVVEGGAISGLELGRDFFRFLRRADAGQISDPFDAGNSFVVARLVEAREAGPAPFEEVRGQVEAAVLTEAKKAVQVAALREAAAGGASLSAIAAAVGADIQQVQEVAMQGGVLPGFGLEPRAVGAIFGLRPGQRSGVVEGDQAAFVVRTTGLVGGTEGELTDEAREALAAELLQRKRSRVLQAWLQGLRDEAEVEDFRAELL